MALAALKPRARQVRPYPCSRRRARGLGGGPGTLPTAELAGPESTSGFWSTIASGSFGCGWAQNTLQWHLHDLWPELELPGSSLFYGKWSARIARRLARAEQTMRVRIARDELRRLRELPRRSTRWKPRSPSSSARSLRSYSMSPVRAADRRQAGRRDRRRRSLATHAKLARAAGWHHPGHQAEPTATASTAAATARSTPPSPRRRHPRPLSPRNDAFVARKKTEGKTTAKRSARSSATSHGASGSCCARPTRSEKRLPTHQFLDKGAA